MDANKDKRLYCAMVWIKGADQAGKRISTYALSLAEAKRQLESEFGEGNVFDLHSPEDADKLR